MRNFHFHTPDNLDEALALLAQYGENSRLMAGGTALMVLLKQSLVAFDHIVSLHRVPGMREIRLEEDGLHIGALVSHREVETSPLVRRHAPLLAEVYSRVATVRIRNVATVGGGLAHADPAQDPQPGLMVLGATVRTASSVGEREMAINDLFQDYYETTLAPGEVITEVVVPSQPMDAQGLYLKYLPRTADDYATVAVAALARVAAGRCEDLRVALGAVGPTPLRPTAVEEALQGYDVDAASLGPAAELVASVVDPLDDTRGSAEYKRDMAVVFTRRALEQVLSVSA